MSRKPSSLANLILTPKIVLITILVISCTLINVRITSADEATPIQQPPINTAVDKICNQIPNYSFCVGALYDTNGKTQDADLNGVSSIAMKVALTNASVGRLLINDLLSSAKTSEREGLERCSDEYGRIVFAFLSAYKDLYMKKYFDIGHWAGVGFASVNDLLLLTTLKCGDLIWSPTTFV